MKRMEAVRLVVAVVLTAIIVGSAVYFVAPPAAVAEEKPYEGIKVTAALHAGPFEIPMRDWYVDDIKEKFGIDLEVAAIPVPEMYEKMSIELVGRTGTYDILQFGPQYMGDYAPYLLPLDDYLRRWDEEWGEWDLAWGDIHEGFRERQCLWGGKTLGITLDGDVHIFYYRKDILGDPEYKREFEEKYGYELPAPPETWEQVNDIAEFFNARDRDGDGTPDLWGYADQLLRGRSFYWYMARYLAFSGPYKDYDSPHWFDPETMEPLINSPEAVEALESVLETYKYAPPGALGWEWTELHTAFMKGSLAMMFHWPDEGLMIEKFEDPIAEKLGKKPEMGFAVMPGHMHNGEVYRRTTAGGGWVLAIAADSKNPDAAYQVLKFWESPQISLELILRERGDSGTDPFRYSHFHSPRTKLKAPEEYLDVYEKSIAVIFGELRIPGTAQYYEVLEVNFQRALAGEMAPKEALDTVAAEWKALTEELGFEKQKEAYWAAMGLT